MIRTNQYFEALTGLLLGASAALALVFTFSVPQAHAYETNILAGSDLTIGSTGQSVVVLQGLLSELGFLNIPANVPQGYFGALTRTALGRYQSSEGITPAAGYFGPITKVGMHQQFASRNWLALLGW